MTILEILKGARDLISAPERWMQNGLGVAVNGGELRTVSALLAAAKAGQVKCMCLMGALIVAEGSTEPFSERAERFERVLGLENIVVFDDSATHAEVLARLDSAITSEKEKVNHD